MTAVPDRTLHELADGVFVWIQPGGESGVSNAGVIVDDDGITVVDTLMVRSQWEPFAAAVERLGRPVRRLVLTHAHIDHVGGTRALRERDGARFAADERAPRRRDAARRVQGVHARVRRRVRRARRARHPAGHPPRHRRRAAHAARRAAPRQRAHRRRRDGARRRRRRAVRRRPLLLRRHAARVPGQPGDVGRRARRGRASSPTRSFPATARSAATPRSKLLQQYLRHCVAVPAAPSPRSRPARGTRGPSAIPATRSTSSAPRSSPTGRTRCPTTMLRAMGFA